MDFSNILANRLKEAIRSLNRRLLVVLLQDPNYTSLSSKNLDDALETLSPVLQDEDMLSSFILHPAFEGLAPKTLANLMILAIRLDHRDYIDAILYHPHFEKLTVEEAELVILEALDFQGKEFIERFTLFSSFEEAFNKHLDAAIRCAIRTDNREWMEELFRHSHYREIAQQIFPDLIRWLLKRRDKKLFNLALRSISLNPMTETLLNQELFNTALNDESTKRKEFEQYVATQLMRHRDYLKLSENMLGWMLEKMLMTKETVGIEQLFNHPKYPALSLDSLLTLLIRSLSLAESSWTLKLLRHPQFLSLSGANLGPLLEEAGQAHREEVVQAILQHPNFEQIPEDSFKRLAILEAHSDLSAIKEKAFRNPAFKRKFGQMIYETIRRNESDLIDHFFRDPLLKEEAINQFINYAKTDSFFVSHYIIRDVLREAFLTGDYELIHRLATYPLFKERIRELLVQAIQYDDEELIENVILNDLLRAEFHQTLQTASKQDKERLYRLFISNPSLRYKSPILIQEVESWMNSKHIH